MQNCHDSWKTEEIWQENKRSNYAGLSSSSSVIVAVVSSTREIFCQSQSLEIDSNPFPCQVPHWWVGIDIYRYVFILSFTYHLDGGKNNNHHLHLGLPGPRIDD